MRKRKCKREKKIESKDEEKENDEKWDARCNLHGLYSAVLIGKVGNAEDESKLMSRIILELEQTNESQSQEIEYVINEKKFSNEKSKERKEINNQQNW